MIKLGLKRCTVIIYIRNMSKRVDRDNNRNNSTGKNWNNSWRNRNGNTFNIFIGGICNIPPITPYVLVPCHIVFIHDLKRTIRRLSPSLVFILTVSSVFCCMSVLVKLKRSDISTTAKSRPDTIF